MEITGEGGEVVKCTNNSSDEEFLKENLNVTSLRAPEDHNKQALGGTLLHDNKSGHCRSSHMALPFYPIMGGARSSQEILAMQPSDIDKKREAFLEYLKQKYPHHASVIRGHQERLREQIIKQGEKLSKPAWPYVKK